MSEISDTKFNNNEAYFEKREKLSKGDKVT
jgi:hypothetical protein